MPIILLLQFSRLPVILLWKTVDSSRCFFPFITLLILRMSRLENNQPKKLVLLCKSKHRNPSCSVKANTGIPSYALTVPMALRVAFLSMAAMSSTKSSEVDHGSKQVVIMYFTPSVFLGSSFIWSSKIRELMIIINNNYYYYSHNKLKRIDTKLCFTFLLLS